MTAPTFASIGNGGVAGAVFVDDSPGASSQATGTFNRTNGRGYLVAVLIQNSITANPAAPTSVAGTGWAGVKINDATVRTAGTNRANLSLWWCVQGTSSNTALTVSYASGDSITSVTVACIEVQNFESSIDPWVISNLQAAGGQSLGAGATTSYYTMNALAHVDNRVVSFGYINGNPGTGFTFEANLTRLFFGGSSTAPTHEIIGGYRNSATPDTTPAITEVSAWTAGMMSVEIRGAGTAGVNGTATPASVAISHTVNAATVTGQGKVSPASTAISHTVNAPTARGQGKVSPASVAITHTANAPAAVTGQGKTSPASVAITHTANAATATGQAAVAPATVAIAVVANDALAHSVVYATPGTVEISVVANAPTLTAEGRASPGTVTRTVTINSPTVLVSTTVSPGSVAIVVVANTPTVKGGAKATPATVTIVVVVNAASVVVLAAISVVEPTGTLVTVVEATLRVVTRAATADVSTVEHSTDVAAAAYTVVTVAEGAS